MLASLGNEPCFPATSIIEGKGGEYPDDDSIGSAMEIYLQVN